ncbi:MAG: ribonuclease P protein component [Vicinamibacterales bacterium]
MSQRFGPDVRLRKRSEFQLVQQQGRRVSTRCLIVLGHPNTLGHDRLGIIASRRFGGAVVRSRAKRRLREVFRLREPDRGSSRSLDIVAIPKRDMLTAPLALVGQDLASAVERLRRGSASHAIA